MKLIRFHHLPVRLSLSTYNCNGGTFLTWAEVKIPFGMLYAVHSFDGIVPLASMPHSTLATKLASAQVPAEYLEYKKREGNLTSHELATRLSETTLLYEAYSDDCTLFTILCRPLKDSGFVIVDGAHRAGIALELSAHEWIRARLQI